MSMVGWHDLPPGLYQVATPDEIEVRSETVTLREADHFWIDKKRQQIRGEWQEVVVGLRTSTEGLLIQAEAIGAHAVPRTAELTRQYCRAEATGYCLRSDGFLEVIRLNKEYDMTAELARAALKELKNQRGQPNQPQPTQALATIDRDEESALALVGTLPMATQAAIMSARLEVQPHRVGLCETKAANRVLRHFIAKAGGILKTQPGFGTMTIELRHAVLVKRLSPEQTKQATDALYGQPKPTAPAAAAPAARPAPAPAPPTDAADDDPDEDRHLTEEERAEDRHLAQEVSAEDGDGVDDEAEEPERIDRATGEVLDGRDQPATGQAPDGVLCYDCQEQIPDNVVAYCQSVRGRGEFGGLNLCMKCQRTRRGQKGGGV